jgi:cytochrome c peroxidase
MAKGLHTTFGGIAVVALVAGCGGADPTSESTASAESAVHGNQGSIPNNKRFGNPSGYAATFSNTGSVDLTGAFFQSIGTNGRSCGSCHAASDGWTVTPPHIRDRFEDTDGTDPIFRTVDGSNRPDADVSTVEARRDAYNMLLTKGLIRIGDTLGLSVPATADYTILSVDDPYGYASAGRLSMFRRPLPTTNLNFLTTVMWDGRETLAGNDHCNHADENGKCFATLHFDFGDQANGATLGHAQGNPPGLTAAQEADIVAFETNIFTAQVFDNHAHRLTSHHALGGPVNISTQVSYYGINDNLGDYLTGAPFTPNVFTIYDAWANLPDNDDGDDDHEDVNEARAAVNRGETLFNTRPITISGVAGLNGTVGSPFNPPLPASFVGACTTCHDTPNGGNHSIVAPLNIGLTGDHPEALARTSDLPLYTIQSKSTLAIIQTTDPGRAIISGKFVDIGKFKGPILRGLAARAPYFHNGSAADFDAVIDFYNNRFGMGLSEQEHDDLVAFLRTL